MNKTVSTIVTIGFGVYEIIAILISRKAEKALAEKRAAHDKEVTDKLNEINNQLLEHHKLLGMIANKK